MTEEKVLLILKYLGKELDLEPRILKKALKEIGVKSVYVGKLEDNAIQLTSFAKWKASQVDRKKAEIEKKIPKMFKATDHDLSRLIIAFLAASSFWLLFGTTVGQYLGMKFIWPEIDTISWLSFGRLRPVHTNTVFWAGRQWQ